MKTPALILFLLCALMSACNHLFYHPDSHEYSRPEDFKVPVQPFTVKASDGETISAWVMNDIPDSKGVVLHFHGNAQNMTAHVSFVSFLLDEGYTVLVFDYRGYGKSTGTPTQKGLLLDGTAVIQWIEAQKHWEKKPKIVIAQSLGGAVSSVVLEANPDFARKVSLFVIESSFVGYRLIAREKLASVWFTWPLQYPLSFLVSDDTKPEQAIKKLTMPKLFMHGDRDQVVPYNLGKLYFEAAAEPKEFWTIPFGNHTEALYPGSPWREKLIERLRAIK